MSNLSSGYGPQKAGNDVRLRSEWSPAAGTHAIVKVSAVVSFSENVTKVTIGRLADAVRELAYSHDLDKEGPINAITMAIGPASPPPVTQENAGVVFHKMRGALSAEALSVVPDGIRFESSSYTRWVAFEKQVSEYLEVLLPVAAQSATIKSLALEYIDLFVAQQEGDADATLVVDRKSDLIARASFKKLEPFHSHCGWFEPINATSRRLVNVDVNVADATGPVGLRRTINVRTHQALQAIEVDGSLELDMHDMSYIAEQLTDLHKRLKGSIGAVLTRDAQNLISLKG